MIEKPAMNSSQSGKAAWPVREMQKAWQTLEGWTAKFGVRCENHEHSKALSGTRMKNWSLSCSEVTLPMRLIALSSRVPSR